MPIIRMFSSSAVVFIAIAACVAGAPVQNQGENIGLNNEVYSQPELAEALARTYEAMGVAGQRNMNPIDGGHRLRQTRRGLDSLSGATFGESKRFEQRRIQNSPYKQDINREAMMNRVQSEGSAKRNFDEIDRTNFDSFVKRNFDEIDRSGFDNFVKRNLMDAYLASRQR